MQECMSVLSASRNKKTKRTLGARHEISQLQQQPVASCVKVRTLTMNLDANAKLTNRAILLLRAMILLWYANMDKQRVKCR